MKHNIKFNRACNDCGNDDFDQLASNKRSYLGKLNLCRKCAAIRKKKHRDKNIDRCRQQKRDADTRLKCTVIKELGNKCVICGEHRIPFLTVDHINNDGFEHRKTLSKSGNHRGVDGHTIYRDIRKQGYPRDKYQILCWNCNCSKRFSDNPLIQEQTLLEQTQNLYGDGI